MHRGPCSRRCPARGGVDRVVGAGGPGLGRSPSGRARSPSRPRFRGHVTALAAGESSRVWGSCRARPRPTPAARFGAVSLAAALSAAAGVWVLRALPGRPSARSPTGRLGRSRCGPRPMGGARSPRRLPVAGFVGGPRARGPLALAATGRRSTGARSRRRARATSRARRSLRSSRCRRLGWPARASPYGARRRRGGPRLSRGRWRWRSRRWRSQAPGCARPTTRRRCRRAFLYAGSRNVELRARGVTARRPGATVAVRRDDEGNVLLQINGKVDATSLGDAATQTLVGMIPVAMARDPATSSWWASAAG